VESLSHPATSGSSDGGAALKGSRDEGHEGSCRRKCVTVDATRLVSHPSLQAMPRKCCSFGE